MNISVIIPVYNASSFLEKAVHSALQFNEVKEVILAEDKSQDNSLEICNRLASENAKVKVFQHPDHENHGAGATRNLGIEKAGSEFIAFLDADDHYLPNRFDAERQLLADSLTEGVFGAVGVAFLSRKGQEEFQNKFKNVSLTTVHFPAEGREVFRGLLGLTPKTFGTFFHLNGLTVRKSSLIKNNLYFNPLLRVHQDSDFIVRLAYHCHLKSGIIDKAVAIRGVHDDNRITKIKLYSTSFYKNNFLLHQSLYHWSREQPLDQDCMQAIKLNYLSFKIANQKGLHKWMSYFAAAVFNPLILKTRYRFHALTRHHNA
ncbi:MULTISPECIES: glycosyltransferase family 2 protein [Chryseobacterium]|uniref:Glycosyltransferase involved in cell wall biosynthesis n=1 Tax=Chryseobacterium camelliae TaxID=1265445 RepID=A0ABU0TQA5_9FLAO|nr:MULTISPECIES: glycosyltransferase family 2 protein [Chryseobacterium]MDT3407622.1 glycosyltransferase involved in cell wall biosynthesis [Pseudacidovorax intermedius]MDQ1098525.1 glycosyltransferase involved in cell wall biosynthesis [Chryseobacterium camelliae]MDQ1102450.1 glycosyltransferase involved in cell wall biosynthesis [Chryseobacterium sp. SORGH_AS_1048]MDR6085883.1 glycosyltransferase involved in cell wall biosynthesis [Chryseobacterium sp. SORGH_AS_0909]MDR6130250.1 glycosyltran